MAFPFNDVVTITTQLRKAKRSDLLQAKSLLRYGQTYYLYSKNRKKFEGIYVITKETSSKDMEAWFQHQMVYVPINCIDNKIEVLPGDFFSEKETAA